MKVNQAKKWAINCSKIYTPEKNLKSSNIVINSGKIESINKGSSPENISLSCENGVMVPGLINGHDHLLGTYYPKVGDGRPYPNWLPWDNDLKSAPVYRERQQIENRDLYLLGAFRNLVSGVTTVSDHIPHFVAEPYYDMLPLKAIRNYALAHSIASFALAWGDGVDIEYKKAKDGDMPFITHIAEGFDDETIKDLATLEKKGGLGSHSVLVHGIAFSESDMKKIKQAGASVVWCADSNYYMFEKTTNIKMLLDMGINVCIGTDSPMSGGENMLYEMKFGKTLYKQLYGKELSDETIVKMLTVNPHKAFKLKNTGMIKEGWVADLVVFKDKGGTPASSVVNAELRDVQLVVIDGRPVYGDEIYSSVFDSLKMEYQHITMQGVKKVIVGDLIGLLNRINKAIGFKKSFPFMPVKY
jgi:cytosine/adenosine deaminase-related metal-dependent hydrolase